MSKLNIQQKASLLAQKSKEAKSKDSNLTEAQIKKADYDDNIKPKLTSQEDSLVQKYLEKLTPLGGHEVNTQT